MWELYPFSAQQRARLPALLLTVAWAMAALSWHSTPAFACTCTFIPTFDQALATSDAIFTAIPIDTLPAEHQYPEMIRVRMRVSAQWRGGLADTVSILTGAWEGLCGFPFHASEAYLVYATGYAAVGSERPLWTHLCSRTHAIKPGDPDLAALGPPLPTPVLHPTWGALKRRYR